MGAGEKKAGEEELTVDAGRGLDHSTVAGPSNMETVVHGAGGKFYLEVTKDMIERMRHFGEQARPRQAGVGSRIFLAD